MIEIPKELQVGHLVLAGALVGVKETLRVIRSQGVTGISLDELDEVISHMEKVSRQHAIASGLTVSSEPPGTSQPAP